MRFWNIPLLATGAVLLALIIGEISCNVHEFDGNDLNYNVNSRQQQHGGPQAQAGPSTSMGRGFAETAKDLIMSPAGQLAVSFAKEMISRSAGNSQVSVIVTGEIIKQIMARFLEKKSVCLRVLLLLPQ